MARKFATYVLTAGLSFAFTLSACQNPVDEAAIAAPNETILRETASNDAPLNFEADIVPAKMRPDDTQFSDVLAEYKALNDRIIRLQAPLRLANTKLCPRTERDPGFITHRLDDYPPHMQNMAQEFLGLKATGIFIRNVRRGSPAQNAQIQDGDEIIAINGKTITNKIRNTQIQIYPALARNAFNAAQTRMTLRAPHGHIYETSLRAQTACDVPASVIFSEDINGHTDGTEVFVTSALVKSVGDDVNLSLVLAHEMAHIIAGHNQLTPSAALELEADRMALVLMHNAGLDIHKAVAFWRDASHPHTPLQNSSATHPSIAARYENFQTELLRIEEQLARGETLTFQ